MSLFDYLKPSDTKPGKSDHNKYYWPLRLLATNRHQADRNEVAHFCEHKGICIRFTRASSSWQAHVPCALKPWWLSLAPLRKKFVNKRKQTRK